MHLRLLLTTALLFSAANGIAQAADLQGTITDPTGAAVAGASVSMFAASSYGAALSVTTSDSHGRFRFQPPAPGRYPIHEHMYSTRISIGGGTCAGSTFGAATMGVQEIALQYSGEVFRSATFTHTFSDSTRPAVRLSPEDGFALSRHLYRVSFAPGFFPETYDAYLARSHARFVATIGGSINVYRVD